MGSIRHLILTLGLVFCFASAAQAQDYRYHSVFLYNFSKYIEWPPSYASGDFVIGIVGESPLRVHLEKMAASKTVGSQRFTVETYATPADIKKCHMLFVPKSQSEQLKEIRDAVQDFSTLIITEDEGLAKKGAVINFVRRNGKWVFELNEKEAEASQLRVSSSLSKLAIIV